MRCLSICCCAGILLLGLASTAAALEQPYLVKQINEQPVNGPLRPISCFERDDIQKVVGNRLYFLFPDSLSPSSSCQGQWSLWTSDGTSGGTERLAAWPWEWPINFTPVPLSESLVLIIVYNTLLAVQDGQIESLRPPSFGANESVKAFAEADGGLYFAALGPLFFTDGTSGGTSIVHDFGDDAEIMSLANFDGALYAWVFRQVQWKWAGELWRREDREGNFELLQSFEYPQPSSLRTVLVEAADRLYFMAPGYFDDYPGANLGLWVMGGTGEIAELIDGIAYSEFNYTGVTNDMFRALPEGLLYFDLFESRGWCFTDGTREGVRKGLAPTRGVPAYWNGVLYYAESGVSDSTIYRQELDGEPIAIHLLRKRILSGPVAAADGLYFVAEDYHYGTALWYSDGTQGGVQFVADPAPERFASYFGYPFSEQPPVDELQVVDGQLLFFADDGVHGMELWTRPAGDEAALLKDLQPADTEAVPAGEIYFLGPAGGVDLMAADDGLHGFELWRSDGTEQGTYLLKDIWPGPNDGFALDVVYTIETVQWNGLLFFVADDGTHGNELWRSDGTADGTFMILEIDQDKEIYPTDILAKTAAGVYFSVNDGTHGRELWHTDGTPEGTMLVSDIFSGEESGLRALLDTTVWGDSLYFTADDGIHGRELWRSDGTDAGSRLVHDAWLGEHGGNPAGLAAAGDSLYYMALSPIPDYTLWRTDGTIGGEEAVQLFNTPTNYGPNGSPPARFNVLGEGLIHVDYENRLWRVELNVSTLIETGWVNPSVSFESFSVAGRRLYTVTHGASGHRQTSLWSTDGTSAGTFELLQLGSDRVQGGVSLADGLLFRLGDSLWITDGTVAGTQRLLEAAHVGTPVGNNGVAYFLWWQAVEGPAYLWTTDGSPAGTRPAAYLGEDWWVPKPRGDRLYLLRDAGHGPHTGTLYALPPSDIMAPHAADLDANGQISLSELLRVVQFYNSGGFHCVEPGPDSEDGYAPGVEEAYFCPPHTSDYNPQDWRITLNELLRTIQFFNSGAVLPCPDAGTEDGFCVIGR